MKFWERRQTKLSKSCQNIEIILKCVRMEFESSGLADFLHRGNRWYTVNSEIGVLNLTERKIPIYVKTYTRVLPYKKDNLFGVTQEFPLLYDGVLTRLFPYFYALKPSFIGDPQERNWQVLDFSSESDELEVGYTEGYGDFCSPDNVLFLWSIDKERAQGGRSNRDYTMLRIKWCGFENVLVNKFPSAERIYTTGPGNYDNKLRDFLTTLGYEEYNNWLWVKLL